MKDDRDQSADSLILAEHQAWSASSSAPRMLLLVVAEVPGPSLDLWRSRLPPYLGIEHVGSCEASTIAAAATGLATPYAVVALGDSCCHGTAQAISTGPLSADMKHAIWVNPVATFVPPLGSWHNSTLHDEPIGDDDDDSDLPGAIERVRIVWEDGVEWLGPVALEQVVRVVTTCHLLHGIHEMVLTQASTSTPPSPCQPTSIRSHSLVYGPHGAPLLCFGQALRTPDSEALISENGTLSYRELCHRAWAVRTILTDHVDAGDHIAIRHESPHAMSPLHLASRSYGECGASVVPPPSRSQGNAVAL